MGTHFNIHTILFSFLSAKYVAAGCTIVGETGESVQTMVFTNTMEEQSILVVGGEKCEMRILAVGGGGDGGIAHYGPYPAAGAGGGSGYLTYHTQSVALDGMEIIVTVGDK